MTFCLFVNPWRASAARVMVVAVSVCVSVCYHSSGGMVYFYAPRLTAVSSRTGAAGIILMTEPSTFAKKAIGRLNTAWNTVSSEPLPALESLLMFVTGRDA